MLNKNHSEQSLDRIKNISKKILILSKVKKDDLEKIKKKTHLLFKDPNTYLKTSTELDFNFIIGKRNKTKKDFFNRKATRNLTSNFAKMLGKRLTKIRALSSASFDIQNVFDFSKKIKSIQKNNNEEKRTSKEKKVKELSNIFSNYRKMINKNKKLSIENNIEFSENVPDFLCSYIKNNLNKQEKALKLKFEYNHIYNKIEDIISKTTSRDNKEHKKNSKNKFYHTSYLFKNSINDYRNKIEDLKLNGKNKKKSSILNNNIRNWERSLRNPNKFIGLRKGYLNINTDERPIWMMAIEKYPVEEEKIIDTNINDLNKDSLLKEKYIKTSAGSFDSRKRKKIMNLKRFNDLQIKGKKLIDFEEQQANKYNGNIKILDFKYDKDLTKDLLFKMNFTLNKFSSEEKLS